MTLDETKPTSKDSAKTDGQTPDGKTTKFAQKTDANSGKEDGHSTTKTYTEEEYQRAISNERSKAGMRERALEKKISETQKESETLKSQLAEKDSTIQVAQEEKERLEAEYAELSKDDPDKAKLYNLIKAKQLEISEAKKERKNLEDERKTWSEDVKVAKDVKRNVLMGEIAGEYKDGDTEILRAKCDELEIPDDPDKIRIIAGLKWEKVESEAQETTEKKAGKEPPHAPSGANKGGRESLDSLSSIELLRKAYSK